MRSTEHMKRHLSIRTQVDNKTIRNVPVEDPFHHTTVVVGFSFWQCFRMLFSRTREVEVRVKVCHDGVSQGRWFQGADICERCQRERIDLPGQHETEPGYHHGDERWCQNCYYSIPITTQVQGLQP